MEISHVENDKKKLPTVLDYEGASRWNLSPCTYLPSELISFDVFPHLLYRVIPLRVGIERVDQSIDRWRQILRRWSGERLESRLAGDQLAEHGEDAVIWEDAAFCRHIEPMSSARPCTHLRTWEARWTWPPSWPSPCPPALTVESLWARPKRLDLDPRSHLLSRGDRSVCGRCLDSSLGRWDRAKTVQWGATGKSFGKKKFFLWLLWERNRD